MGKLLLQFYKKFKKDHSGGVIQWILILCFIGIVAIAILPKTRFFTSLWYNEMTDDVINHIGFKGDIEEIAYPTPYNIGGTEVDDLLKPITIEVKDEDGNIAEEPFYHNYNNHFSFHAISNGGAPPYDERPPYRCTWTIEKDDDNITDFFTISNCDIELRELERGIYDFEVRMCDKYGACGTGKREVALDFKPIEVDIKMIPTTEGLETNLVTSNDEVSFDADVTGGTDVYIEEWYYENIENPEEHITYYPGEELTFDKGDYVIYAKVCDVNVPMLDSTKDPWCGTDEFEFSIKNSPPSKPIIHISPETNLTTATDVDVTFTPSTDIDGDELTYTWVNKNTNYNAGTQEISLFVSDGDSIVYADPVEIVVLPETPTIVANEDLNGNVSSADTLIFQGGDDNGELLIDPNITYQFYEEYADGTLRELPEDNHYGPGMHKIIVVAKNLKDGNETRNEVFFTISFSVLEIYPIQSQLGQIIADYGDGKAKHYSVSIHEFNSNPNWNVWDYDMLIFGFSDSYGGSNGADLTDQRLEDVLAFGNSGRGVMLTHDTLGKSNFGKLSPKFEINRNKSSYGWWGDEVIKVQDGDLLNIPYEIKNPDPNGDPDVIPVSRSHVQPGVAEGDIWLSATVDDNRTLTTTTDDIDITHLPPGERYYITSHNNWVYTTSGHSSLSHATEVEKKLLVNTIFYTSQFRQEGLVGHYTFSDDALDSSEHANHGTVKNFASFENGLDGTSLSLDGESGYISIPNDPSLDLEHAITIEAWVFPTDASGENMIINKEHHYEMALHDGKFSAAFSSENSSYGLWRWVYSDAIVPINTWSHVAASYDGTTVKLYVNGKLVKQDSVTESGNMVPSNYPTLIGNRSSTSYSSYFDGKIDNVKIHNHPLTIEQLRAIYGAFEVESYTAPTPSLDYWELETSTVNTNSTHGLYVEIDANPYWINQNSYLQYDVYHDTQNNQFQGAVEITFTDGTTMRDYPSANDRQIKDIFGLDAHPSSNLDDFSKNNWYRRTIDLGDLSGKTVESIIIADETDSLGKTKLRISNIRFVTQGKVDRVVDGNSYFRVLPYNTNKNLLYVDYIDEELDKDKAADYSLVNGQLYNHLNFKNYNLNGASIQQGPFGDELVFNSTNLSTPIDDYRIDKDSDYVTASFWFKKGTEDYNYMPFAFEKFDYWCSSGTCGFNTQQGDRYGIDEPYNSSEYVHTVVIFKQGDVRSGSIYINGVKQSLSQKSGTPDNIYAVFEDAISFSSWSQNTNYTLDNGASMSEIKVWDRALTDEEVLILYTIDY